MSDRLPTAVDIGMRQFAGVTLNCLTPDEQERIWYALGLPTPVPSDHVGAAEELEEWREAGGVDTPAALASHWEEHDALVTRCEAFKQALLTIASEHQKTPLADVIQTFVAAPELHDFDRLISDIEASL